MDDNGIGLVIGAIIAIILLMLVIVIIALLYFYPFLTLGGLLMVAAILVLLTQIFIEPKTNKWIAIILLFAGIISIVYGFWTMGAFA